MSDSERLRGVIDSSKMSARAFSELIGLKSPQILYDVLKGRNGISKDLATSIKAKCLNYNIAWLLTGKGEMYSTDILKTQTVEMNESVKLIPLLPISAQGGSLNDFFTSIKRSDCEKIISPIKDADSAITVSGDSMSPEYVSGSKVLIKKINEKSFIEWGRCYVLDTCNGTVIKKLAAPQEEDPTYGYGYVTCISSNDDPIYSPFRVSFDDIHGIYRVLMLLTEK